MAMLNMTAQNVMQDHMTLISQMAAQVAHEQIMRHRAASTHSTESPATADGRTATTARPTQPSSPAPGEPNTFPGISMYQDGKRDGELNKWLTFLSRQPYQKRPPLTEWLKEFWVPNGYWEWRNVAGASYDSTHKANTLVNKKNAISPPSAILPCSHVGPQCKAGPLWYVKPQCKTVPPFHTLPYRDIQCHNAKFSRSTMEYHNTMQWHSTINVPYYHGIDLCVP